MTMKPEESSEILLWNWLKTKGMYIQEVYFNRINKLDWKIFNTKGTHGRKPDLIIKIDRGYGIEYIAVEVKSSKRGKDVYDAQKILDYYEDYITGKAKYFIDKEEIKINHFAIATDNSCQGHLLSDETSMWDNLKDPDDLEYKKLLVETGCYPQLEFYATGLYLRILWANWRRIRKRLIFTKAPSVGILITDLRNQEFKPYFFTMIYCDWLDNKKPSWGQRFWNL